MQFTEILAATRRDGDTMTIPGPDSWKQGRTLYGGLTASLCLHAARELTGEARQLRSALISFAGPSSDAVTATAKTLRSGRTAATVLASLSSGDSASTQGLLTFSDLRDSSVGHASAPAPQVAAPSMDNTFDLVSVGGPAFAENFDIVLAGGSLPMSGSKEPDVLWWGRHKDPKARDTDLGLLCIGDMLPPAALTLFSAPAPMSSMTWMIDFVGDDLVSNDGWYLFQSKADVVHGGFSTQDMSIWNAAGELVAKGRQTVTLFG